MARTGSSPSTSQIVSRRASLFKRHSRTLGHESAASLVGARVRRSLAVTVELPLVAVRSEETDLARLGVFGHVRTDIRRDDQDPDNLSAFVSYLVASSRTTLERHHVSLAKLTVAVVQTHDGLAAQNDNQLLASVVEVVDELGATGLELPD